MAASSKQEVLNLLLLDIDQKIDSAKIPQMIVSEFYYNIQKTAIFLIILKMDAIMMISFINLSSLAWFSLS